ncbi:MAG: hypothetical protein M5U01_33585 [Ardenticatenaceae bacterium]|nr:hypothetical protein [Ardenticatenaceae bacterium]HBY96838.1 toxin HicA [Chloroflexota bacterium]
MSKREKLLQKIRNNPRHVTFKELGQILTWYGFRRRQPGSGSSHSIYTLGRYLISVPYKRPYVKAFYVKHLLDILDEIDEERDQG